MAQRTVSLGNSTFLRCAYNLAVYNLNFFCGFVVSLLLYWLLCKIWIVPRTSDSRTDVDEDPPDRNSNLVYGFELSDKDRSHDPSTDTMLGFSTEEGLDGDSSDHEGEAGSAKSYERQGLLATDPE